MSLATESSAAQCLTCYGNGEAASDWGVTACPDCGGCGTLPAADVLVEWRMRAIEKNYAHGDGDVARDVAWLAFELRRARQALVKIMTVAQADAAEDDALATRIRFLVNDALHLYEDSREPG